MEVWHSVLIILGAIASVVMTIVKTHNSHKSDHQGLLDKLNELSEILADLTKGK